MDDPGPLQIAAHGREAAFAQVEHVGGEPAGGGSAWVSVSDSVRVWRDGRRRAGAMACMSSTAEPDASPGAPEDAWRAIAGIALRDLSFGPALVRSTHMPKPTVYIETTVISYRVALPSRDLIVTAHQHLTRAWWNQALPALEPYVSPFVLNEISRGDPAAARERLDAVAAFSVLGAPPEVEALARRYFDAIAIPAKARIDSLHLAMAAWHGMDYLVSWNCTHIASARVRRIVGGINDEMEIRTPVICTPEELMEV